MRLFIKYGLALRRSGMRPTEALPTTVRSKTGLESFPTSYRVASQTLTVVSFEGFASGPWPPRQMQSDTRDVFGATVTQCLARTGCVAARVPLIGHLRVWSHFRDARLDSVGVLSDAQPLHCCLSGISAFAVSDATLYARVPKRLSMRSNAFMALALKAMCRHPAFYGSHYDSREIQSAVRPFSRTDPPNALFPDHISVLPGRSLRPARTIDGHATILHERVRQESV